MSRTQWILRLALVIPLTVLGLGGYALAEEEEPIPEPVETTIDILPPVLSLVDKTAANALAKVDPFLKDLLEGRPSAVVEVGPWTTANNQLVGVAQVIRFDQPQEIPVRYWPQVQFDPTNDSFDPFEASYVVHGLTEVQVLIDLRKLKVYVTPETYDSIDTVDVSQVPESKEQGES